MPYRSNPYGHRRDSGRPVEGYAYEYPPRGGYPQNPGHPTNSEPAQHRHHAPARGRRDGGKGYTLIHAGRQVRLGPVAFWIVVGTLVVMAGWSVLTGTYFAFHDDVLKRLIARQAEMQFGYEDRIAELRAQVDRIASRQLLDQEQFEQKLDQLVKRQATLEQRASTLGTLPDPTPTGSIRQPARSPAEPARNLKPSPINDTIIFVAPPEREARLESRILPYASARNAARHRGGIEGALSRMQESLDRVEVKQAGALNTLEESFDARARRIRGVLADLGIEAGKTPAPTAGAGATGGPFVPANMNAEGNNFERQLYRINLARGHVERLNRALANVPVRKPVAGEIDMSSGFGMRMDPFIKAPAMHTGLDMRGDPGDPVRATANGTVSSAGPNGGYGKMIEIEHGHGLSTRYAHLSEIDVKVGQQVRIGQIIGKIGSTGRSTGPHLHYETRVDGDPVDPQKYLRAGIKLGSQP